MFHRVVNKSISEIWVKVSHVYDIVPLRCNGYGTNSMHASIFIEVNYIIHQKYILRMIHDKEDAVKKKCKVKIAYF